ncbi:MAG: cyclic pyranopterin monophosphate synthase MoaC [Candidatus Krumholzibacteriia bacterium]
MGHEDPKLTHLDERGRARMVDVGDKPVTRRVARARAHVTMSQAALRGVQSGTLVKGDVLAVARLAGIQAAKQTSQLIPLCHVLGLDHVDVDVRVDTQRRCVAIGSRVTCRASTGAEMEAIVAVSIAAATVYDMCKAVDREMTIGGIQLLEKSGGRSGTWKRSEETR